MGPTVGEAVSTLDNALGFAAVARAYVGDTNGAYSFSASVEHAEAGPFAYTLGPEDVDLGTALTWARSRADQVVLRVGNDRFSAGRSPVGDLPHWRADAPLADDATPVGKPADWEVEAHVNCLRSDAEHVDSRLAEAISVDPVSSEVIHRARPFGFALGFSLSGLTKHDARELASEVLRTAWHATGIQAVGGQDFDVSSVTVRRGSKPT
jgi:hypothetical protein